MSKDLGTLEESEEREVRRSTWKEDSHKATTVADVALGVHMAA